MQCDDGVALEIDSFMKMRVSESMAGVYVPDHDVCFFARLLADCRYPHSSFYSSDMTNRFQSRVQHGILMKMKV